MKKITMNGEEVTIESILSDWETADSEEEKLRIAVSADAMLTTNKEYLTLMEKAKLLKIAAYLDGRAKKIEVETAKESTNTMSGEVADIMTEFVAKMCKLADKYGIDRDEHMKRINHTFTVFCATSTLKNFFIGEGND